MTMAVETDWHQLDTSACTMGLQMATSGSLEDDCDFIKIITITDKL